ncbi:MAG: TonB-dependent receptor, partial [Bacteroidales bacterium]|nr:TonB-dependent receptor [Bacteroidales bacterium]
MSPYEVLLDEDGNYNHINASNKYDKRIIDDLHAISDGWSYDNMAYNPLQDMRNQKFRTKSLNARLNAALNARITEGIKYSLGMQYMRGNVDTKNRYLEDSYYTRKTINDFNKTDYDAFLAGIPQTITEHQLPSGEIVNTNYYRSNAYVIRNQFSLDKIYGDHGFNFIAGTELNWNEAESQNDWLYGYNHDKYTTVTPGAYVGLTRAYYPNNNLANVQRGGELSYSTQKFFSLYSNLAYTYRDKYTLSGSIRTDASNITVKEAKYRYAPFWSVGGSWQLSKEAFLNDNNWINRLILRATYGVNGNIPMNTAQVPLISYRSGTQGIGALGAGVDHAVLNDLGNPTLGWEKVKQLNIAIDYAFFNNRLFGSVEYYNKNSFDLVAEVALPSISGTDMQAFNVAELQNNGIELNLNSNLRLAPGLNWRPVFNFAYNNSVVNEVKTTFTPLNYLNVSTEYVEGYDYWPMWSYKLSGETNEFGIPLIDAKNDVQYPANVNIASSGIDGPDLVWFRGSKVAPYVSSLTNEFTFKGFSLLATITGKFGHYMYNPSFSYTTRGDEMNHHKDLEYLVDGKSDEIGMFPLPETT